MPADTMAVERCDDRRRFVADFRKRRHVKGIFGRRRDDVNGLWTGEVENAPDPGTFRAVAWRADAVELDDRFGQLLQTRERPVRAWCRRMDGNTLAVERNDQPVGTELAGNGVPQCTADTYEPPVAPSAEEIVRRRRFGWRRSLSREKSEVLEGGFRNVSVARAHPPRNGEDVAGGDCLG